MSEEKKTDLKIYFLVLVIAILAVVVYKASVKSTGASEFSIQEEITAEQTEAQAGHENDDVTAEADPTPQKKMAVPGTLPSLSNEAEILRKTPLNEKEIRSVSQLSSLMFKGLKTHASTQSFTNAIKALGLKVSPIIDENPYTGRMTILRTEDALEGTRYLHIQMSGNNAKDETAQHMSFQLRPGSDSFAKAMAIVEKNLPKGSKIKEKGSQYASWTMPECYETRVHAMDMDDLQSSKYNAVSKDDVGTINVVVEQDPHCGAGHGEHDHDH